MTNLSDTLAVLSDAATQGEWVIELDPYDAPFPGICPAGSPFEMASFTMGEDADENQANADFVVALVSAYRTGQLVPVPSVERVARVIASAMGDNYSDAFKNKGRWIAKRGMSGGRFRDVNEPMQCDYDAAATAVIAAMQEGRDG